jgi:LCP family protein required for cell wall assembly
LHAVRVRTGGRTDDGRRPLPPPVAKSAAPSPSPSAVDPLGEGAYDVLLIGTDSRDETSLSGNADTIMLVHVPADRSGLYLVSFTRDMHVPIPGLGEGKINAAFSRGGTDTLAATVSELLGGVEVDLAMQTNFNGFINLTRALDGIEVDNKHHSTVTVSSTGRVVDFPEGRITLENTDGLIYVRERKRLPLGDLDRTERQRATVIGMLDGIAEHADDPVFLAELVALLHGNVKVTGSLGLADFVDLVPLAAELDRDDVVGLMVPITGFGTVNGASVNLVDEAQTAALGEALRSDTMDAYVEEYGTDYAP